VNYLVMGAGMAAAASARVLLDAGHDVTVVDRVASATTEDLATAGAHIVIAPQVPDRLAASALLNGINGNGIDEVIVSPGVPPHDLLASAAVDAGLDVYSEPELAWRLRGPDHRGSR
jgi:UDP-N-acetylmuramoylalanine--D-glutamate ligase